MAGIGAALLLAVVLIPAPAPAQSTLSLRFFGNGMSDIDRVKIRIDAPAVPADVGAGDFTLEFWMKATSAENGAGACTGGGDGWITGNSVFDRDVFGSGDFGDWGVSLFENGLAFGVAVGAAGNTICGATDVDDGVWHHVAVTRDESSGALALFVDGQLDASGGGPSGNASYRDGRSGTPNDPFLVIGAEKHDAGPAYPSYSGFVDEVRLSNVVRYTSSFAPPTAVFTPDGSTVALYHFEEGPVGPCITGTTILDASGAPGGPSHGVCRHGGTPAGPLFSTDVPPLGSPSCGNGMTDPGEQCDDGDLDDCDGCDGNCTVTACGNGVLCAPEQCDDGNLMGADGCEADCTLSAYRLLSGKSLLVKDAAGDPTLRRIVFLSRDAAIAAPAPGTPGDPRLAGATLRLARGVAEVDAIPLPASGWQGIGNPAGSRGYRYSDPQRTNGPCRKVSVQTGRRLRAACSGSQIDFTLDEPMQGALAVTFEPGSGLRSCVAFGGTVVKDTSTAAGIGRFKARNAPPPPSCPLP
jgi:cysteine-rich repeat protein